MTTAQLVSSLLIFIVVVLLIYIISLYNGVQRLFNIIPEATSNIAVLRKKRTDLIAKLISIVESYDMHESGIADKVSSDFGGSTNATNMSGIVQRLASLRMAFPELKADSLYESLMQELAGVETDIANRREQYNSIVRSYNIAISQFPANVVLTTFGFQPMPFLSEQELSD